MPMIRQTHPEDIASFMLVKACQKCKLESKVDKSRSGDLLNNWPAVFKNIKTRTEARKTG